MLCTLLAFHRSWLFPYKWNLYLCLKYPEILFQDVPVVKRIGQSKIFFAAKGGHKLEVLLPRWLQGLQDIWFCFAFALRRFTCYQLKLLFSLFLHCSPPEPTALLWQTERWKSQRGVRSGDSSSRGRALKWVGLVFVFSRGECTGGVGRGGTWETTRVSWKMKAVWNSGSNTCVPLAQLSLKTFLRAISSRWSTCEISKFTMIVIHSESDFKIRDCGFIRCELSTGSLLRAPGRVVQNHNHGSIYRHKIWQCPWSDKVLSAMRSTIHHPHPASTALKERDKQQRRRLFDGWPTSCTNDRGGGAERLTESHIKLIMEFVTCTIATSHVTLLHW